MNTRSMFITRFLAGKSKIKPDFSIFFEKQQFFFVDHYLHKLQLNKLILYGQLEII